MRKFALVLLALWPGVAMAQTSIGQVGIDPTANTVTCTQSTAANLKVDGSAVTQPVSGTVTCNAGTNLNTSALATQATLATIDADTGALAAAIATFGSAFPATGYAAFTDGTNARAGLAVDADTGGGTVYVQGVNLLKRASGGPVEAGTAADPLRTDPTGSTTQPVSGTVTANLSATDNAVLDDIADGIAVTGSVTANAGTNLNTSALLTTSAHDAALGVAGTADAQVRTVQGIAGMTPVLVDGSGATQPVSGTVTITDGAGAVNVIVDSSALPSGAATSANQDGIIRDGAGDTTQANVAGGRLSVDPGTVNVIVDSSALPSGAATSANQDGIVRDGAGDTTQANVSSGALHVAQQGNLTIGTFPDNEPVNVAQINGVAVTMGNGASGTGVQRVTLANDSTGVLATVSTVTNLTNLPNEGQQTAANSISVAPDTDNDAIGAEGSAPPGEYVAMGGVTSGATGGFLNGVTVCTEMVAVDIVTATTTLVVTGVSGRHVYICSLNLVTAGANNVAIIAGTGATCGTSTAGLNGGTTAAEGWNFAANGGIAQGGGLGHIMSTRASGGATGDSVCIVTSAAVQLAGTIGFAIY